VNEDFFKLTNFRVYMEEIRHNIMIFNDLHK
jgi:hypothetical protein